MMLYQTMAPTPGRVLGLVRLLQGLADKAATRRELCDLMDPPTLRPRPVAEPKDIGEILGAAAEAGLAEDYTAGGKRSLRLASQLPDGTPMPAEPATVLPDLMARLALRPQIGGKPNRFAEACAWLLTQPVIGAPQGHNALRTGLQAAGFDLDEVHLRTELRLDNLLYWAVYLGLVWRTRETAGHGVVPDPTAYLRRNLDQLLPRGERLPVADFVARLGEACPVLDGGAVRTAVLRRMEASGIPPVPAERLSDALSFALRRLRKEELLGWSYVNDSFSFCDLSRGERVNFLERQAGRAPS
jgi:hypothetical protein